VDEPIGGQAPVTLGVDHVLGFELEFVFEALKGGFGDVDAAGQSG